MTNNGFALHTEPVWRERSNFIINAPLAASDYPHKFEQLFTRKVTENTFEICCIPFFLWNVALGDVVSTTDKDGRQFVMNAVVRPSGRYVFRVWFGESFLPRNDVAAKLTGLGALLEWSSVNLLAVDAANEEQAELIAGYLVTREAADGLIWETGKQ